MSLTSSVSCVSDAFSSYYVSVCLIYCNLYHSTNQISLMMSLTMMVLVPGPLVHALFLFVRMNPLVVLDNPLVVSVA